MRIVAEKENVVVQGMRPEENWWGKYQFPIPYKLDDRIAVSVHVEDDTIITTGNPARWFESFDNGETWSETGAEMPQSSGFFLKTATEYIFPKRAERTFRDINFPPAARLRPIMISIKKPPRVKCPLPTALPPGGRVR